MSFNRLEADDFVVSAQAQTQTCWTNNLPVVSSFFTQSNQVSTETGKYYVTVFDQNPTGSAAAAQFEIAYGNSTGGGAFLEFLEGKKLPAVAMLEERAK